MQYYAIIFYFIIISNFKACVKEKSGVSFCMDGILSCGFANRLLRDSSRIWYTYKNKPIGSFAEETEWQLQDLKRIGSY